jgi:hypothetical protein
MKSSDIPSSQTLRRRLDPHYLSQKERLKYELKTAASKLSLTMDCWTSKNQHSFLGITVHYIDSSWTIRSSLLDFVPVNGPHTGENLAACLFSVLEDFKISEKIVAITTDNASNNDTMLASLGDLLLAKGIVFIAQY